MKVILFFLLLIGSFICQGQHSANYRTWTIGDGKNFSIKEYETPYTISLYTERNDAYSVFVLTNHDTKISLHIQTPEKLVVNDFWISHDSIFFCGYTTNRSQKFGIIGFFDIDDLFYHHGSFFYQDLFYAKNNVPIVEFTRMVSYLSGNPYQYEYGNRYIACIGSDSLDRACIVEMYRHPELEWGYTSGTNDNLNSETLKDITLVGNHIVTSGFWGGMRALCLRVYDYPGIFNSGIEDMAYLFDPPSSRTWQDDDVRLATESVDAFATDFIWIYKDSEHPQKPKIIPEEYIHKGGFTEIKQVQAIYPYDYELQTECEQE